MSSSALEKKNGGRKKKKGWTSEICCDWTVGLFAADTHGKSSILDVCRTSLSDEPGVIFSFSAINI